MMLLRIEIIYIIDPRKPQHDLRRPSSLQNISSTVPTKSQIQRSSDTISSPRLNSQTIESIQSPHDPRVFEPPSKSTAEFTYLGVLLTTRRHDVTAFPGQGTNQHRKGVPG
ncbi:hypothetical protein Pdw03_4906 [Penicillium digitatum]|uniref:Uncharacterized protein n=1 Tax=Penicillium digitatum TaxID=36651 RepID=A0A7T7BJG5_PENDI|nr:hypothetical protein Pdw03_4906 [Penicillium digitatum]